MSSDPRISDIRSILEKNLDSAQDANRALEKAGIREALEHNLHESEGARNEIEEDLEQNLANAERKYKKDRLRWGAHVRLRRAKKLAKAAASKAIDHVTVVGSTVLAAPALYSTDQHIKNLQKISTMVSCKCGRSGSSPSSSSSDFSTDVGQEHCKRVLLPYIQEQKARKFDRLANGLIPGVGVLQTVSDAAHAAEKASSGTLHAVRGQRARELMAACKSGCLMANAIAAELLGSFSDISAQTELEAHKKDSQGWSYLAEKMLPKG
jgi:hypothetical protein